MANSYVEYTSSGTGSNGLGQRVFTAPTLFRHIDDIRAKGLSGSTWTELSISARGTTTVTLSAVPTGKSKVRIYRQTPADPLVDFTKGAALTSTDLDSAYNQGLMLAQEVAEQSDPSGGSGISGIVSNQLADNLTLGGTPTVQNVNINGTIDFHGNNKIRGYRTGTTDELQLWTNDNFKVRTGTDSDSYNSFMVQQKNSGTRAEVTAPLTTTSDITNAGNKALITKEYADANYVSTSGSMALLQTLKLTSDTGSDFEMRDVFHNNVYDAYKVLFTLFPKTTSNDDPILKFFIREQDGDNTTIYGTSGDWYTYAVRDLESAENDGANQNTSHMRIVKNNHVHGDNNNPARRYIAGEFTIYNPMNPDIMGCVRGQSTAYWGSGPTHSMYEFAGGLDDSSLYTSSDGSTKHKLVTGFEFDISSSGTYRTGSWIKCYGIQ